MAFWALTASFGLFAEETKRGTTFDNVIFTTITKWLAKVPTTPARVGGNEVKEAGECCVFYNI